MQVTLNQDVSTKTRDESLLRNHLLPALGDMAIADIGPGHMRALVADRAEKLAPPTVALVYQLGARIFRCAEEDGLIVKSPCTANIKLPRLTRSKRADRWLTIGELEHLAECITPRFHAAVLVMGYMGLRFGEFAGLKRAHLDLLHGTLEVASQMKEVSGRQSFTALPKTASGLRKLPLPASLAVELDEHLAAYSNHSEYVFSGRDGAPLRKTWARRHFAPPYSRPSWRRSRHIISGTHVRPYSSREEPTPRTSRNGSVTPATR